MTALKWRTVLFTEMACRQFHALFLSCRPESKNPVEMTFFREQFFFILFLSAVSVPQLSAQDVSPVFDFELEQIATGLTRPCEIVNDGIHPNRMYVLEQPGRIRLMDLEGNISPSPFLDISSQVNSSGNEQGLLGLAFSPDFAENGHFFVNYTQSQGSVTRTRVTRFTAAAPNFTQADPNSEVLVLDFIQDFGNHNGGQLDFGPDGYLYIATGDGGSGGDPNNRSQDLESFLGKLLRIDVSELPYSIPPDNPFIDNADALDEIWAYGLRNAWKNAFDEETGDLYIADVGQNAVEELNFQPASSLGGENYGWRCYEGSQAFNLSGCGDAAEYVFPVSEYTHPSVGNGNRCSVTGGRVYRGSAYPLLTGKYFMTDWCSGEYWILWQEEGEWQEFLSPDILTSQIVAFGPDLDGEIYVVRGGLNGSVHKLTENCSSLTPELGVIENTLNALPDDAVSYEWYLDGVFLTETEDASLEAEENGIYTVLVTAANGCRALSNEELIGGMSVEDLRQGRLGIFPNPASDEIRIRADFGSYGAENAEVMIFSAEGKLVKRERIHSSSRGDVRVLNTADLNPGFYIVRVESEGRLRGSGNFVKK